ncbi:MAG TPA: helix-turn-helix domain-containing protein, partial [Candidatus Thermoplasmatota archaeon]|nr:helix-turn-helix domain-containing protein [Candidatus Thermoplasmatota archaeon]
MKTILGRMPSPRESPPRIMGRFVGRAEEFGFAVPPVPLRLKLLSAKTNWTLFLQSTPGLHPARIVEWLPTTGLLRIEFGSRSVMRADYRPLPEKWATTFQGVDLQVARLDPSGEASATVTGSRQRLAAFARRLYGPTAPLELVQLHAVDPPATFLTLPQDDALRAAVAAGYYRIPRALNLHELAQRLHISSASLSERLRRAEGRIITRYVEVGSTSPWDERTLFAAPLAVPDVEWPEPEPGIE